MNKKLLLSLLLLVAGFLIEPLAAFNLYSPLLQQQQVVLDSSQTSYQIPAKNLIKNSLQIWDAEDKLLSENSYQIDYASGQIEFQIYPARYRLEYAIYPDYLSQKFSNYRIIDFADTNQINLTKRKRLIFNYDPNLKISGNKTISITVANDADFKLDQSLFLKIDGELSENLFITAQLNDSQSPITPEGDSRELSNLDKVYLKLYGEAYEIAFGDLELQLPRTDFVDYAPKFEGFLAGWYPDYSLFGALAISKGERLTVDLDGVEAKQGPYYLSQEISSGIQIVAGSEQVYLDGSQMQRGEDYTIDYSEGSITFSNLNFISENSQIRATFQYADQDFRQSIYLASAEADLGERFSLRSSVFYQIDDKDNPLQLSYLSSDLDSLQAGGDGEIWGDGAVPVEDGEYIYNQAGYYEYVGNDSTISGTHNLAFSEVEAGDYLMAESEDYYYFAGTGAGDYLPIRQLTAPEKLGNINLRLQYRADLYQLYSEVIFSEYDQNIFSELDSSDDFGYGISSGIDFRVENNLLQPQLKLNYRLADKNLKTISETTDAQTAYEITTLPDTVRTSKFSGDFSLNISEKFKPGINYSRTEAQELAQQDYWGISNFWVQQKYLPKMQYRWFSHNTVFRENLQFADSEIKQHQLETEYLWQPFRFSGQFQDRREINRFSGVESGLASSFYRLAIAADNQQNFSSEIFFKQEVLDSLNVSWGQKSSSENIGLNSFFQKTNSQASFTLQQRRVQQDSSLTYYLAGFSGRTALARKAIDLSGNYALQNLQFYPKIRELEFVGSELGIYDSLGVVDEDGEYDFVVKSIDYDNPEMSVEVSADLIMNLKPGLLTESYLERFRYENYYAVTENSQSPEKSKIYYLSNQITMNDSTTIYGRVSQRQTLWYDLIKKAVYLKVESNKIEILDNRYQNRELNEIEEISFLINFRLWKNSTIELEYQQRQEINSRLLADIQQDSYAVNWRRRISSDLSWRSTFAYHQSQGSEASLFYENSTFENKNDLTWFLSRKYRLVAKFDYKHNQRDGAQSNAYLDRNNGHALRWDLFLNYRINDYTFTSMKYSAEKNPKLSANHKVSLEVKAEF
ncbi:MAG: hypothetical protein R6U84_05535 [Candidatus Cloacimonadales bacterium]